MAGGTRESSMVPPAQHWPAVRTAGSGQTFFRLLEKSTSVARVSNSDEVL
jgi:hypothetical protein